MTLSSFPPQSLDQLALRLLDIAAILRQMAESSRENEIHDFQLNGNKAHEWLRHLDHWAQDARLRLHREVLVAQGERRHAEGTAKPARRRAARPRSARKK